MVVLFAANVLDAVVSKRKAKMFLSRCFPRTDGNGHLAYSEKMKLLSYALRKAPHPRPTPRPHPNYCIDDYCRVQLRSIPKHGSLWKDASQNLDTFIRKREDAVSLLDCNEIVI